MSSAAQATEDLIAAIVDLARELSPSTLGAAAAYLEKLDTSSAQDRSVFTRKTADTLQALRNLLSRTEELTAGAAALALRAAARAVEIESADRAVEIAWTGPSTTAVPVRRVDQVLYELIGNATRELVVVTYAAYRAERALAEIAHASRRGVSVNFVLELGQHSGGKVSFDLLAQFKNAVPLARIYYWPLDRRRRNDRGGYGSMHAKSVIADRHLALVSSANLTDHALDLNIELGFVVGRSVAERLAIHFDQLIVQGELAEAFGA